MASVMGICGGLVKPKSENVKKPLVLLLFFEGPKRLWERVAPPQTNDFETILGMEILLCTRCLQKSVFENVLPAIGGEHMFAFYRLSQLHKKKMQIAIASIFSVSGCFLGSPGLICAVLGSTWGQLGPTWGHFGPT